MAEALLADLMYLFVQTRLNLPLGGLIIGSIYDPKKARNSMVRASERNLVKKRTQCELEMFFLCPKPLDLSSKQDESAGYYAQTSSLLEYFSGIFRAQPWTLQAPGYQRAEHRVTRYSSDAGPHSRSTYLRLYTYVLLLHDGLELLLTPDVPGDLKVITPA